MGVPAFFRWLTKKYPSVVADCVEDRPKQLPNGKFLPVDASQKNPNNVEFHNLYLDMNGIIHPCTHPEDRPAPKNEDEMMVAIFEFIDRIFAIVRPRRLLYMAIDGVAPRAKMNQQRSRRFRASKEIGEKVQEMARIKEELEGRGAYVPPQKEKGEHFDSNCITPGTPFMHRLSACLHYYVHDRLRNDPAWKNITVILSDANVPGEGEHKIMDYIRRQRVQPTHDANTQHVLCGADADLIMLGLATHEPNFTIIREEFKPNKPRPCDICGQLGHEMKDCQGAEREKSGEHDEIGPSIAAEQNFIFVKLNVLREYLERDLQMSRLPPGFTYDLERAIDDWVFMCFFVGNDFLPHLPSLEIRENAIDRLVTLYKETVYKTGKWVTDSGFVDLECVQMILTDLGHAEDEIFKKRQENELQFRRRQQNNKRGRFGGVHEGRPAFLPQGQFAPRAVGRGYNNPSVRNAHQEIQQGRIQAFVRASNGAIPQNNEAAAALRAMLRSSDGAIDSDKPAEQQQETSPAPSGAGGVKRKHGDDEDDEFSHDEVRLWEDGFKERYYESKFAVSQSDEAFRSKVACEYVRGLCWVLQYYYQGVPSWKWYFPYHYAPFASDCTDISSVKTVFKKGTKPFRPLEQLMGVFPAASGSHVPSAWAELMKDPESPIIDFYPEDFKIDLNGKKFAWQGVALLPFVDEKRLKRAVKPLLEHLTEDEKRRNCRGEDLIFVGKHHPAYDFLRGLVENSAEDDETPIALDPECIYGISGHVFRSDLCVEPGGSLDTPVRGLETIYDCHVVCLKYRDPIPEDPNFKYPACRLAKAVTPQPHLKPGDYEERTGRNWTPRTGMTVPFQRGNLGAGGHRMMQHHVRPHTPHPFPRQSGPRMGGAAAFFDNNSSDHRQMSRGGQHGGRGGDWNRSSNESGGRGGWGSSANAYPPPQDDYRRQQQHHGGGGGGYSNHQNRYNNQSGPPSSSNLRGNEYGQQGRGGHQQPHYPPHNQQQPPRRPPPQNNSGGGGGGYGYYTSGYQGQRY